MSESNSMSPTGGANSKRFETVRAEQIRAAAGVPEAKRPQFDESRYASRVQRRRKGLRLEVQGLKKAELWCAVHHVDFQDLVDGLLRVFLLNQMSVPEQLRRAKRSPFSTISPV